MASARVASFSMTVWSTWLALLATPGAAVAQDPGALRALAIPIRTIDPRDDEFTDLLPLVDRIGSARVVVLGEATHSEGTTSQAKSRLVRFLHQVMGFDVLAWETGVIQAYAMNAALRDVTVSLDSAKSFLMSGGWAREEGIDPVFAYARETWRTDRPLEMAGFDTERPRRAAPYFMDFLDRLGTRVPSLALLPDERASVDQLTRRAFGFRSSNQPTPDERARQRRPLERLLTRVQAERANPAPRVAPRDLALAEHFVRQALRTETISALSGEAWNFTRDSAIAAATRWLATTWYPDRKIIIWAATSHFVRHSDRIANPEHPDWYTVAWEAGNHLYPFLGDDLYTIGFTAYGGEIGDVFPQGSRSESSVEATTPAPVGSLEAAAHALQLPYLFLDLRRATPGHWLRGEYVSLVLGRLVNIAPWADVLDAFFFIDRAEPVRYLH